jgi:hypothetical protein
VGSVIPALVVIEMQDNAGVMCVEDTRDIIYLGQMSVVPVHSV